jgi:substrate import-associated zinc metallohydrolase lipoprotein
MKKNISIRTFLLLMALVFTQLSCRKNKDDLDKPFANLGGVVFPESGIDVYAKGTFQPYNVRVIYRWDATVLPIDKKITPIDEDKVIPILEIIKKNWLDIYNKHVPYPDFLKVNNFKQIILVGGKALNNNRTETLATAEGGIAIIFYGLNEIDISNNLYGEVNGIVHTMQHEFIHILNQRKLYPREWESITKGYDANWVGKDAEEMLDKGFISPYASSNDREDFAETASIMLMAGKPVIDLLYQSLSNQGASALKQKEKMVAEYFKNEFDIDFYALQKTLSEELIKNTPGMITDDYVGLNWIKAEVGRPPYNDAVKSDLKRRLVNYFFKYKIS